MKQEIFGSKRKAHTIIVSDLVADDEFHIDITIEDECVMVTISDRQRLSLASKRQRVCMMLSHGEFLSMVGGLVGVVESR